MFPPITFEIPRVLLPIANVPLINYTIESLVSSGVTKIILFTNAHYQKVLHTLTINPQWHHISTLSDPVSGATKFIPQDTNERSNIKIYSVVSKNTHCQGDALREIRRLNLIKEDFLVVSGDIISNLRLEPIVESHLKRKEQNPLNVMTVVCKRASPNHPTRSSTDDLVVGLEGSRLLFWESNPSEDLIDVDFDLILKHPSLDIRYDLINTDIIIFTQDALQTFFANPDFRDISSEMVPKTLANEVVGQQIHIEILESEYAARVRCHRTYNTIAKDIIRRWTYPMVLDSKNFLTSDIQYLVTRPNIYLERGCDIHPTSIIIRDTVIGRNVRIGPNCVISKSVLGDGCTIESNVKISDSHLWNNVEIKTGSSISESIIASNVTILENTHISSHSVISFNCIIGPNFTLPAFSRITLVQPPKSLPPAGGSDQDDDGELDDTDTDPDTEEESSDSDSDQDTASLPFNPEEVGPSGRGRIWEPIGQFSHLKSLCLVPVARYTSDKYIPYENQQKEGNSSLFSESSVKNAEDRLYNEVIIPSIRDINLQIYSSLTPAKHQGHSPSHSLTRTFSMSTVKKIPSISVHIRDDFLTEMSASSKSYDIGTGACLDLLIKAVLSISVLEQIDDIKDLRTARTLLTNALHIWRFALCHYLVDTANDDDNQLDFLYSLQKLLSTFKSSGNDLLMNLWPVMCLNLYQEGIIKESSFTEWYSQIKEENDPRDLEFIAKSAPFINWLDNAEEEEDESSDESGSETETESEDGEESSE